MQPCQGVETLVLTSATTVDEILDAFPDAHAVLHAHDIDTCCGGALNLEQVARLRVIEPAVLVARLQKAFAPAPAPSPPVRPALPVCPASPPAAAQAKPRDARPPRAHPPAPEEPRAVFSPFATAALVCTLTFGAVFGAYNLLVIHLALGPMPPSHSWAHAGFQLFGFVLLFIMGVALHAVPRFLDTHLRLTRLASASLPLGLAGLLLVAYSRFGALVPGAVLANGVGSVLQLASVLAWATALTATFRAARAPEAPWHRFLVAGTIHWVAAAFLLLCGGLAAVVAGDADAAAGWNDAVYAAALFGGTLSWISGMLLRTAPVFLRVAPARPRAVLLSFWLGQAGAVSAILGGLRAGQPGGGVLDDVGLLLASGAVVSFVVALRPLSRGSGLPLPGDPHFVTLMRLALGGALMFALLAALYAVPDLLGRPAHRLVFDGARHAFALGFVTLTILAMAGRMLPRFAGVPLRWPRLRLAGGLLVVAGMLMRETQVLVAFLEAPSLLSVSASSGVVAATGVALAATSILGTLAVARRARAAKRAPVAISLRPTSTFAVTSGGPT